MDVDVTSQSAGSLENLMTISMEKTIIDDEVIARVRRIIEGLRIDEETFSMDLIKEVKHGGSYLMHKSTLKNFREGWQPSVSDWNSYEVWQKSQYPEIEKRAEAKVKEILDKAVPLLDDSVAKSLREYIRSCE